MQDPETESPIASTSQLTLDRDPILSRSAASESFYRDARLCPDSSSLLCSAEDRSLSLFSLSDTSINDSWKPEWVYKPSDSLLSYEWYPGATRSDPTMCCFAVAIKDHPVQLIDGNDLRIRASYPIIDHQERFVAPHSMAFSPSGTQLFAGFDATLEIIDIASPGSTGERIHTSPTRSSKAGQKGIISTLDFSPNGSGLLAAGSFSGTVGLYDTSISKTPLVHLIRSEAAAGVTKVKFHPSSHLLYISSRLSSIIEIYDIRNLSQIKGKLRRTEQGRKTNQRIGFDLDPSGEWLVTGDASGGVQVFEAEPLEVGGELDDGMGLGRAQEPFKKFMVARDGAAVGATLFASPTKLLTCSGSRTFKKRSISHDTDSDLSSSDEEAENEPERSLKLWELH